MLRRNLILPLLVICAVGSGFECDKKNTNNGPTVTGPDAQFWLTTGNGSSLLEKQSPVLSFGTLANNDPIIDVDSSTAMQTVDGFGYTLTGGSAYLINKMDAGSKAALLDELFGNGNNSIGISYLRVSIGASDLNASVFSYDDMPTGQTDLTLANFSLAQDTVDFIPVLKQILAINPNIKILGSP